MNFWHGKGLGRIKNLKPIIAKELYENYNFPAGLDLSENVTTSRSKVFDDNAWETSESIPYATEDYEMYYPKLKQGGSIKYQKEGFYEDVNTTGILDKERSGSIEPPSGQKYWTDWNQYFQHANPSEMGIGFNKDFLLKQIKNPAFRNRYRENYKLVTGEYPTDQELDTRLNAQINYVDMGPDHALSWPYSSTLPDATIYGQGIKKEH